MADWDPYNFSDAGDESDSDGAGGLVVAEAGSDGGVADSVQILARLADTASSGAMFERKAAARGLVEVFRQIYYAEQDVGGVIAVIERLVDDVEHSVRTEVMDQMPQIALFCHEESPRLDFVVPQHILPHIVRALTDHFTQVRSSSQSGLLTLLERGIIASSQVTNCVLPIITDCIQDCAPEELRSEMTGFMIKLAPLAGKEITVNSYLELFVKLCHDPVVQVRKVCAAGMGDLANVIGTRLTEIVILPKFVELCKDKMWGVRKSCAEVFTVVATVSQLVTRKRVLAPAFVSLLQDSTKWVRVAAYQTLGPFITTFAADDSTTCTQDSSEIEQTFLERFMVQQQEAMKESDGGGGGGVGGGGEGVSCLEGPAAAGVEEERRAGAINDEGEGTKEEENGISKENVVVEEEDEKERKLIELVEETTTGSEQEPGCDTVIAPTSDLFSTMKNMGEPDERNSSSLSSITTSCETESQRGKDDKDISSDNSSERKSSDVDEEPELKSSDPTLPPVTNDITNQECFQHNIPDAPSSSQIQVTQTATEGGGGGEEEEEEEGKGRSEEGEQVKEFDCERLLDVCETTEESGEARSQTAVGDEANVSQSATTYAAPALAPATGRGDEGEAAEVVLIEKKEDGDEEKECSSVGTNNDTQGEEDSGAGDGLNCMGNLDEPVSSSNTSTTTEAEAAMEVGGESGSKEEEDVKVSCEENIEVIEEAIEMSLDEESPAEAPGTDENVNNAEEPMETDELFDGVDDDKQEESERQGNENGDFSGPSPFHSSSSTSCPATTTSPGSCSIQVNCSSSPSRSIADVHRSYMNLYNASRGHSGMEDGSRMPSVRLLDTYDDDDWDPETTFPYGDDLSSVWGGKGCRPRLLQDIPKSLTVSQQDVVPVDLMEHYTGMCEPMRNQGIDNALTAFCAYNLPAVVLTLGPQNWSILRECYESLACSMQWKIRYTLASSLHEIARVIGPELAERDLVPFFNALVKDVDEVRVGILKNLANFIKILGTVERRKCLENLRSFLDTDNERNWRFRLEMLHQLEQLTDLYEADEVYKYLRPLALDLVKDGVAEVRKTALSVITNLILRVRSTLSCGGGGESNNNLVHDFLSELVESLCHSDKWVRRQTFAALSGQLIGVGALKPIQFAEDVLPHLANLSCDPVPNVRLIVAQTMVSCVKKLAEFDESSGQLVGKIIETLQYDKDRDVRYFSCIEDETEQILETCE